MKFIDKGKLGGIMHDVLLSGQEQNKQKAKPSTSSKSTTDGSSDDMLQSQTYSELVLKERRG